MAAEAGKTVEEGKKALYRRGQESFLGREETPLLRGIIHPAIYWKGALLLVLALIFLLGPAFNLGVFLLVVAVAMLLYASITRRFLLLLLTDQHVIVRSGIAFAEVMQIRHSQIESINLSATLLGQIFGYAAVVVAGTGRRVVMVPFIANASAFRAALEEVLVAREEGRQ